MTEQQGLFSIPARLLLEPEQRAKLEAIVHARGIDLSDLLSEIVADYLAGQPDMALPAAPERNVAADLAKRRRELASLIKRRDAAGTSAPSWLGSYIAALEAEIAKLEG